MPDILIRGVALPKYGCAGCYFKTGKYCGIIAKNENVEEYLLRAERHPDCPLLELPPHGDLKDARQICEEIDDIWDGRPLAPIGAKVLAIIDSATVVVPAERREG